MPLTPSLYPTRVLFVGASGVGKTTLAKWAARRFDLPLVASNNSGVYADHGTTPDECWADPHKWLPVQREINERVCRSLQQAAAAGGFVSDRAFDVLIYTHYFLGGRDLYRDWDVGRTDRVIEGGLPYNTLLFVIRPQKAIIETARGDERLIGGDGHTGGRRARFLSWETACDITAMTEQYLDDRGYPYVTIDSPRMRDRTKLVERLVVLARAAHDGRFRGVLPSPVAACCGCLGAGTPGEPCVCPPDPRVGVKLGD